MNNNGILNGKIPPQAVDLEPTILGSIILESFVMPEVNLILDEKFFYTEQHQKIYRAIKQLYTENKPIDIMTVPKQLEKNRDLEICGGAYYIMSITRNIGSSSHIEEHIRILTEKFIAREQIRIGNELSNKGYDPMEDVFKNMDFLENSVSKLNQYIIGKECENDLSKELENSFKLMTEKRDNKLTGINTGSNELNKITGGFNNGNMIILCGRPSMGKTTRALQFILSALKENKKGALFSIEMNKYEIYKKLISNISEVSANSIKDQNWNEFELQRLTEAKESLKQLPLYLNDKCGINSNYLKTICRERKRKHGLDLIVIDYLQLIMSNEQIKHQSEEQRIANISLSIKTLAKDLQVPVIILSQLSRECESRTNKRPVASDLRYSGAIEQDADLILSMYRPVVYYKSKEKDNDYKEIYDDYEYSKISELGILKNRTGESGMAILEYFDGAKSKYYNSMSEMKPEPIYSNNNNF